MSQNTNGQVVEEMVEIEAVAKAKRRQYTAEYKLRVLCEVDACQGVGKMGALLRRGGLYSSLVTF